jgi:hypothetical protein
MDDKSIDGFVSITFFKRISEVSKYATAPIEPDTSNLYVFEGNTPIPTLLLELTYIVFVFTENAFVLVLFAKIEPVNSCVFVVNDPLRVDPVLNSILDVMVCTLIVWAVKVPAIVKLLANDAVAAYDADVAVFAFPVVF